VRYVIRLIGLAASRDGDPMLPGQPGSHERPDIG
jgi:hypothetical protein